MVQQLVKIGCRSADKTCSTSSTRQAGRNDDTFPGEETQKFQEYTSINQNYWNQRIAAVERLPVFDDGETNRWRMMFTALWTKRLISRQPF